MNTQLKRCFNCGSFQHLLRECKENKRQSRSQRERNHHRLVQFLMKKQFFEQQNIKAQIQHLQEDITKLTDQIFSSRKHMETTEDKATDVPIQARQNLEINNLQKDNNSLNELYGKSLKENKRLRDSRKTTTEGNKTDASIQTKENSDIINLQKENNNLKELNGRLLKETKLLRDSFKTTEEGIPKTFLKQMKDVSSLLNKINELELERKHLQSYTHYTNFGRDVFG